jgi:protein arginine N-methyltransferase 1
LSLVVDEHRQYLADRPRINAFAKAIAEVVRPGQVVVDLASGTGILGLMACRAGAARVYSIEAGGMVEVAREAAKANGFADRVVFVKGFSTHVDLPEKVDVVIGDQIGNFGFNAGVLEYYSDARARFLKPEGVTLPSRVDLWLMPVEAAELFGQVEFWNTAPAGFDFRSTRALAANTGYQVNLEASAGLGDPVALVSLDVNRATVAPVQCEASAGVKRSGVLHGIGGWFSAQLSPSVRMTNSPLDEKRINRRQIYFPIDRAVAVEEGDTVRVRMMIRPGDLVVNWNVEVISGTGQKKGSFRHSTWKGMLLNQEDFERTRPDFRPKLTRRGEGRRTVVNLCDGMRALAEVEEEVWRRHPELFRNREEAAAFVAEVVTRYSE